ncbi:MAG: alpha/beta fold hydrolase, partial [Candidatus Eremiobacteraeota bacterium]|nr:alpha/beta fold hydrolase [Candidatus Eremiobacteraeota bacterium]
TLLAGSVYAPRTSGRHRAVVLLHGSGPESRWGTIRYIADQLARNDVTTLIYDKRGSGDSGGDWRTASYADLADDAIAGIKLLQARSDVDGRRIGIWGHSQGGYIAPLVAARCHDVAFIVAADSPAMAQYQQDIYRVRNSLRDNGWTGKTGAAAMTLYKQFIEVALTGKGFGELAQAMERNKKEPWLAWMGIPPKNSWLWPWYRQTGYYDSRPYWRNVKVPVLLVYGELDELQPVGTSIATIQRLARANGNQDVEAFILPAAPHVLHIAPKPGERFFWWHFVPGYPSLVIDWIKAHGKN